jgi:Uma2 family endonuclease
MPAAHRPVVTEPEYLAFDLAHEGKHEFVNGEIVAMAGVSWNHGLLQGNVQTALAVRLRGRPCVPQGSDLRVAIDETGLYAYPDVTVVCGRPELKDTNPPSLLNPTVIVEVLSPSTESYDLGAKAAHYRHRTSVQALLFVDSRRCWVQLQTRNTDGTWTLSEQTDGTVRLAAIDVELPVAELYERVDFTPPAA